MDNTSENRSMILQQCSEDLMMTIPRLAHCFRPHSTFPLQNGGRISVGQGRLLMWLASGKHSVSDLAQKGHVSLPTISRKIDLLEQNGLVSRLRDPEDRRTVLLEVTDKGRRTLAKMRDHLSLHLSDYLDKLSEDELLLVQESLSILRKAFDISDRENTSCP